MWPGLAPRKRENTENESESLKSPGLTHVTVRDDPDCIYAYVEALLTSPFENTVSLIGWELPKESRMASQGVQGSSCLHFLGAQITRMRQQARFFNMGSGD